MTAECDRPPGAQSPQASVRFDSAGSFQSAISSPCLLRRSVRARLLLKFHIGRGFELHEQLLVAGWRRSLGLGVCNPEGTSIFHGQTQRFRSISAPADRGDRGKGCPCRAPPSCAPRVVRGSVARLQFIIPQSSFRIDLPRLTFRLTKA